MLTAKQQQLLAFIDERLSSGGVSPSFDEMKDALDLKSKSGVHRLVNALEERGFIRRLANRARALEVLKLPEGFQEHSNKPAQSSVVNVDFGINNKRSSDVDSDTRQIPLHGKIAAGTPIEAIENADSFISVPQGMTTPRDCFALEVSGESMIELGIMDGDTVIIESGNVARSGDVVVALVDREEATLKTLEKNGAEIALVPANRDHQTQVYKADRVQVQGKLVGLFRQYH
ncbi:transcriptional repressor LexA [Kordiimonas aquimaris]|uniref:transcriptional repressor LexA n=1 Tax=Kordiimonas aquimaris TaxID=707591 RepID=UPI0021D2096B|nr:transcriptional repressor LexA [Kordiimonas aquimaris]